jgi:hypothetical protein
MMRHSSSLLGFVLFVLLVIPISSNLFSESGPTGTKESPVELRNEPHHHLKFENQYVRVWDTLIPAHEATLWHVHSYNNVVLTLADANVRVETIGADPAESQPKLGDVGFRKAPYTHRTMSIGDTPFHNMAVEILALPKNLEAAVEEGRTPLIENEQVRIYRISLAAGESTGIQTDLLPGLLVAITSGNVEILQTGQSQSHSAHFNAADVQWHEKQISRSIQNAGKERFEAVDIELK